MNLNYKPPLKLNSILFKKYIMYNFSEMISIKLSFAIKNMRCLITVETICVIIVFFHLQQKNESALYQKASLLHHPQHAGLPTTALTFFVATKKARAHRINTFTDETRVEEQKAWLGTLETIISSYLSYWYNDIQHNNKKMQHSV
jgi:hypothetical protein